MRVGLFIPCHVDQLWPEVGLASLALLERAGVDVSFPEAQTCCGQMHHSVGDRAAARALALRFTRIFDGYDAIVAPSGSCVAMVRVHYPSLLGHGPELDSLCARTYELCEFLHAVLRAPAPRHAFPHRVGLHAGCHALRELRLGSPSEGGSHGEDPARALLTALPGLELVPLARPDECCGFGGAFCVEEEAVSCRMGLDRLADHRAARAEVLTSSDPSCLLHLRALARRHGSDVRVLHVAQILAGEPLA
jgi:L-lactate dehydrogenase complex protein LldE